MNLHSAVYDGDIHAVKHNLDNFRGNANIKSLALVLAAATGRTEIVHTFLKTDTDINLMDILFNFQRKWESHSIKLLHRRWQTKMMPFSHGWSPRMTPLCAAAFFGHADIVKMLVDAGADINFDPYSHEEGYGNRPSWNALTCALLGGNEFVAVYLMLAGARATECEQAVKPMAFVLLKKNSRLPLEMIGHTLSYI